MKKDKIRTCTILASIFLHLLILLFIQIDRGLIFPEKTELMKKTEDRLVFELVETPENIKQELPDAPSALVSDKNTRAADLVENDLEESHTPFQKGNFKFPEFQESDYELAKDSKPQQNSPTDILKDIRQNKKSFLETFQANQEMQKTKTNNLDYDNLVSQVKNHGGMSLNTYQWEFAPYLLEMKQKVQSHNNPPFAFTHLGAIGGDILLRFKVMQDGSVKDLEILASNAHYSLEATSTRAIQFSAPFKPLPVNFPKEYLEITALFSYILGK
ncbi:MAG: energy transducer TonB [Candidatus Cloacimonadales bacterium]|nr:energy transducer TonB [Candidatus Cloacimonadales bacterium]